MKHPMAKILTAALTLTLLTGAAAWAAEAGTAEDPLVTLSYMTGTFRQELQALFESSLSQTSSQLASSMDEQVSSLETALQREDTAAPAEDTAWETVTLSGNSLSLEAGAQVLFLSGSASLSGGSAVDTTAGTAANGALAANHLYVVGDACTLTGQGQLLLKP